MLTKRFDEALVYASRLHAEQTRKCSETPYLAHLLAVASLALERGANEDEAIAALLHDAGEDQGGRPRLEDIRRRFGDAVAAIVEGCSDALPERGEQKPPWRPRKEAYIAHLPHATPSVRLVSACDKLHNARCLLADLRRDGAAVWPRFNGGRDGSLWYYRELAKTFRRCGPAALAEELGRVVADIERLAGKESS
ncbi:MAG: HD domain-containing protein [Verrucomicrobia bacterium]|nr:HD domain-containing protein [Verrucomicrobiota bacterium]